MRADGDGDRQRFLFRQRALGKLAHVVRRDDVDAGDISFLEHEAIDARVDAKLRVFGDNHAAGNHRPAVHDREDRHRQIVEIHFLAGLNNFFHRRVGDSLGLDRFVHRLAQLIGDVFISDAHAERDAIARLQQAGNHGHRIPEHIFKQQRLLRLRYQRGDIAQIDGLIDLDQLVVFP